MTALAIRRPVRAGFDPDDLRQVRDLAIWRADQAYPGDRGHAKLRAREAAARWKRREAQYHSIKIPLRDTDRPYIPRLFETLLVREILDLLPLATRDEALMALISGQDRKIQAAGRKIRRALPSLAREGRD